MEKKTYKEQNGTSRVGDWLRAIGRSDILEKAINMAGDIASGDYLGAIKTLIKKDTDISPEQEKEGNRLIELDYKDIADARDMYKGSDHKTADEIAKKVIRWNILIAFASTIVLIACVIYIDDKVLIAIISASLSALSTSLMQERQQVINFFFGSSIGSKEKTGLLKGK